MKHGFPNVYFGISLGMPVPVLMQFGSDREFVRERVLNALKGEEIWCQLFSEPSGGTDLAGLRTRAETDGNGWKINGQKVWTSWAQYSDYGVIVVRSEEHTYELQSIMRISYDVFCLKKKKTIKNILKVTILSKNHTP